MMRFLLRYLCFAMMINVPAKNGDGKFCSVEAECQVKTGSEENMNTFFPAGVLVFLHDGEGETGKSK